MAINVNLSNAIFTPNASSSNRSAGQVNRDESAETSETSPRLIDFVSQSESISTSLNANDSQNLELINNQPEPPSNSSSSSDQQISNLEQQQTTINNQQRTLQDQSERIDQQIRALEQQERSIDQRISRLSQSQALGLIVDLRA